MCYEISFSFFIQDETLKILQQLNLISVEIRHIQLKDCYLKVPSFFISFEK